MRKEEMEANGGGEDLDEIDSSCSSSTTYYSAPSSPVAVRTGYSHSAPMSPTHFASDPYLSKSMLEASSDEFEFSARFTNNEGVSAVGSMSSADELFMNGRIRPMMFIPAHLRHPHALSPPPPHPKHEEGEEDGGMELTRGRESRIETRTLHRRARSHSPLHIPWRAEMVEENGRKKQSKTSSAGVEINPNPKEEEEKKMRKMQSSSSSSTGKGWIFLKDFLLHRSKHDGRSSTSSPLLFSKQQQQKKNPAAKERSGVQNRRVHREQSEETRKRTFLPYKHGVLGCLALSSRRDSAMTGLARTLKPLSYR